MHSKAFVWMIALATVPFAMGCRFLFDVDEDPLRADCTHEGERRCHNNTPQVCKADWQWSDEAACPPERPICFDEGQCSAINSVSAGGRHSCILLEEDGSIRCWGRNEHGELGDGTTNDSVKPVKVVRLNRAIAVKAGGSDDFGFTCAITAYRGVECWGHNTYYQLGDGDNVSRGIPNSVINLEAPVIDIALGAQHACALLTGGVIKCWGNNAFNLWATPTAVAKIETAASIDAGAQHTCALTAAGQVYCWGSNLQGQCGQPMLTMESQKPIQVPGILGASTIATGYYHTCALVAGHTYCWGSNDCGQLGRGDNCGERCNTDITKPKEACGDPIPGAIMEENAGNTNLLDLGAYHSCIGTGTGSSKIVRCWGRGDFGQVGFGAEFVYDFGRPFAPIPAPIPESHAVEMSVGAYHGCALTIANEIRCWGRNDYGQLGIPATVEW